MTVPVQARKVLVVLAHPRRQSLCGALADGYIKGAAAAGADVRRIDVMDMTFDPLATDLVESSRHGATDLPVEPDLRAAQESLLWADHLVFVYPSWWGTGPTLLKAFVDRTLMSGIAFRHRAGERFPDRLLAGRSARLVVTMDTPPWWNALVYRRAGHNAMRRAVLGFCGVTPVRISSVGPVRGSDERRRRRWIDDIAVVASRDVRR
jgi:putative NADPH-quinone reductase